MNQNVYYNGKTSLTLTKNFVNMIIRTGSNSILSAIIWKKNYILFWKFVQVNQNIMSQA